MLLRAIVLLTISTAAAASNLSFLQHSAIARFDAEDIDLMLKNADAALDDEASNAKHEWSNPKTGSSGFAEVRSAFVAADGRPCKRLRVGNRATGTDAREATYTLCKDEQQGWMLDSKVSPGQVR